MRWDAFEEACPELATLARDRFGHDELVMLGTIRPDGSPRLSPCEVDLVAGRLCFGMMWRSKKALDLLRDPRLEVLSVPKTRMNPDGDVRLRGRAVDESDPNLRQAYRDEVFRRIAWAPDEPEFHLFSLDIERAAFTRFGEERVVMAWDPDAGLRRLRHPDDP
jgi:uncharacterized pyridoxamine 5'-phosphate oxidase family protein